uniref:E3 ubiquitin-protein ligase RNF26 n=1 Tax=Salarias fasciatus TaxID=181472 RepID=A0A672GU31_SALFA
MGLVNVVISTVGKCLDTACLLLDLNFLVVHTVVQTILAVVAFINSLPALLLGSLLELGNLTVFCLVSLAEATSNLAHGSVYLLGTLLLALEGLLESLKMVGYLSLHCVLRGKDHLCRGLLAVLEGCGIAVSLVVYFTNTVVNYALIAMQNLYLAVVGAWQTVSAPLQKLVELALTTLTFLHSTLVGTSALLWSPCKLVLDFLVSLVHMFVSIFILNIYGLVLTVTITRLLRLTSVLRRTPLVVRRSMHHLQSIAHRLYLLERGLWQQLSQHSSQLGLALRTQLNRHSDNDRARGDGDAAEERRDPPDGRAGEAAHQEPQDTVSPSSSRDRPLKKQLSSGTESKAASDENLLTLLKEQEERKKCVICQDFTKTVVLLPCRHLCLCRECTNILLRQPIYQQNCPLCRHMILNTMDVYL